MLKLKFQYFAVSIAPGWRTDEYRRVWRSWRAALGESARGREAESWGPGGLSVTGLASVPQGHCPIKVLPPLPATPALSIPYTRCSSASFQMWGGWTWVICSFAGNFCDQACPWLWLWLWQGDPSSRDLSPCTATVLGSPSSPPWGPSWNWTCVCVTTWCQFVEMGLPKPGFY